MFRTKLDTEVILHEYREWGIYVLTHLNGMFGLAIWDDNQRGLILACDRMGIKPLYYNIDSDRIYFASEILSLLYVSNKNAEIYLTSANL